VTWLRNRAVAVTAKWLSRLWERLAAAIRPRGTLLSRLSRLPMELAAFIAAPVQTTNFGIARISA